MEYRSSLARIRAKIETFSSINDRILKQYFKLTELDRKILAALQVDSRLSNQEIADRAASSASSVWRRIKALQQAEVIKGFRLGLDAEILGLAETVMLHVSLNQHSEESTKAFTALINDTPEVIECYAVSGDHDYQLKVLATDMRAYYRFLEQTLMSQPYIARTSSTVIMKKIKETQTVPTEIVPR
jgi:DNA-binding Lrp family transcriptional regulator